MATTAGVRKSELPGWFWGALGCMTVLVVGLVVIFLMGRPRTPAAAAVTGAPGAIVVAPGPATGAGPGIRIEPMAAPPSPPIATTGRVAAAPAPHPKAASHAIKVAHSPASPRPTVAAKPAADDGAGAGGTDATEEELLKPKPRAAAPAPKDEAESSDDDNK